jgi:hypothetical protein
MISRACWDLHHDDCDGQTRTTSRCECPCHLDEAEVV